MDSMMFMEQESGWGLSQHSFHGFQMDYTREGNDLLLSFESEVFLSLRSKLSGATTFCGERKSVCGTHYNPLV
jgi:hypothetical protein